MKTNQIVHRLSEEAGARDGSHSYILYHPLTKFKVCISFKLRKFHKLRNINHNEVCTLRNVMLKPDSIKTRKEKVPLFGIDS